MTDDADDAYPLDAAEYDAKLDSRDASPSFSWSEPYDTAAAMHETIKSGVDADMFPLKLKVKKPSRLSFQSKSVFIKIEWFYITVNG